MCGIFGFIDWRRPLPPVEDLGRVTNLLTHRGPDRGAYWTEDGAFLGHRRLAIIDLATGGQPMLSGNGRYVITFNGEIYNYPELREELRAGGAVFRTTSDTEVILEGYRLLGPAVIPKLEGMFAFAIYDRHARTVCLARDRFGEKPLLVAASPGRLVFASELAPLAAAGAGERAIDLKALGGYLCLNYVPGTRTMMRGIERLAPSTWALYDASGAAMRQRYWDVTAIKPPDDNSGAIAPALDEFQSRLDAAVKYTLRSDVPVGLFLSGGTDSALVAESATRQGHVESAFCVDFAEQGFSEWPLASWVAKRVGVDLVRVPLDAGVLARVADVAGHLDDPLADSSAMAVWTVAAAAGKRLKVVLSGDGGDELFGGYLTYAATQYHAAVTPWLPRAVWSAVAAVAAHLPVNDNVKVGFDYKLQRLMRALPFDTAHAHFMWNGTWIPSMAAALVRDEVAREEARTALQNVAADAGLSNRPSLHELQLADIREYLPNDILTKVDRATMAHGLESRAPLLDRRIAEFALSLPRGLRRTARSNTKVLLRALCERHFGVEHARAPKQGFSLPLHRWLRHEARSLVTTLLDRDRVAALHILDPDAVTAAVDAHLSGRRTLGWELWGLMVLVSWYEQRVASPPTAGTLPTGVLRPVGPSASAPVTARL